MCSSDLFAGTTLDSATRIQRYVLQDTFPKTFKNRYFATAVVILFAVVLVFSSGANGKGALALWPLFGAVNQTLAALALLVVTIYLRPRTKWGWLISALPAAFMFIMAGWAAVLNQVRFGAGHHILLQIINLVIILSMVWVLIEAIMKFSKTKYEGKPEVSNAESSL